MMTMIAGPFPRPPGQGHMTTTIAGPFLDPPGRAR
jgi:hypothetical protein